MTNSAFKQTMKDLGYEDISTKWIRLPNIARINLTSNAALYREETRDILAYYYYNESKELLYKAVTRPDGVVIGVTMILSIDQITAIETRNAMSASMFSGQTY